MPAAKQNYRHTGAIGGAIGVQGLAGSAWEACPPAASAAAGVCTQSTTPRCVLWQATTATAARSADICLPASFCADAAGAPHHLEAVRAVPHSCRRHFRRPTASPGEHPCAAFLCPSGPPTFSCRLCSSPAFCLIQCSPSACSTALLCCNEYWCQQQNHTANQPLLLLPRGPQALIQPLGLFRKRALAIQQLSHDYLYKQASVGLGRVAVLPGAPQGYYCCLPPGACLLHCTAPHRMSRALNNWQTGASRPCLPPARPPARPPAAITAHPLRLPASLGGIQSSLQEANQLPACFPDHLLPMPTAHCPALPCPAANCSGGSRLSCSALESTRQTPTTSSAGAGVCRRALPGLVGCLVGHGPNGHQLPATACRALPAALPDLRLPAARAAGAAGGVMCSPRTKT